MNFSSFLLNLSIIIGQQTIKPNVTAKDNWKPISKIILGVANNIKNPTKNKSATLFALLSIIFPKSTNNNINDALKIEGGKPVIKVYKITKIAPDKIEKLYGSFKKLAIHHQIPKIKATFKPLAAKRCKSPEFLKSSLIFSSGFIVSLPKIIPPNISILGDFMFFECLSKILFLLFSNYFNHKNSYKSILAKAVRQKSFPGFRESFSKICTLYSELSFIPFPSNINQCSWVDKI